MFKRIIVSLFVIFTAISLMPVTPSSANVSCVMAGKWRSNEKLTLLDMNANGKITNKQRAVFENKFFGRMVVEFTCTKARAYFIDYGPNDDGWENYTIVRETPDYVEIKGSNANAEQNLRFKIEGNCYKMPVSNLGFSEYFCRE